MTARSIENTLKLKRPAQSSMPEVNLDRTITADFFYNRTDGATAERTIAWLQQDHKPSQDEANDLFKVCPNDASKVSLHYWWMHRFAKQQPNAKIDYVAIDDNSETHEQYTSRVLATRTREAEANAKRKAEKKSSRNRN